MIAPGVRRTTKASRDEPSVRAGCYPGPEEHRRRQLEERIALGRLGRPAADGFIFTDPLGEPLKPDSFSQMFTRQVAKLDLPRVRLHDLRHSAASLMLQSGANVKTVSERLGHASTSFTMDVYAASVPALEEETAAKVAALLDWAAR